MIDSKIFDRALRDSVKIICDPEIERLKNIIDRAHNALEFTINNQVTTNFPLCAADPDLLEIIKILNEAY